MTVRDDHMLGGTPAVDIGRSRSTARDVVSADESEAEGVAAYVSAMTESLFGESVGCESVVAYPGGAHAGGSPAESVVDYEFVTAVERLYGTDHPFGRSTPPQEPTESQVHAAPSRPHAFRTDRIIDVSVRLDRGTAFWPSSPGVSVCRTSSLEQGDPVNASTVTMDVHAGTHVDAPLHHVAGGLSVDQMSLERCVGPAQVIDVGDCAVVTAAILDRLVPCDTQRLLLRTRNSSDGRRGTWHEDYVSLALDAAVWLSTSTVKLVGIDYLSIQQYGGNDETHRLLFRSGIVVLEGLDLTKARPGPYQLVCLPLLLVDAEAAPARVILIEGPRVR